MLLPVNCILKTIQIQKQERSTTSRLAVIKPAGEVEDARIIHKSNSIPINLNKFTIIILIAFRTLAPAGDGKQVLYRPQVGRDTAMNSETVLHSYQNVLKNPSTV